MQVDLATSKALSSPHSSNPPEDKRRYAKLTPQLKD